MALAINTEKSRSEYIIAPILAEVRQQLLPNASLFSGILFSVDTSLGLDGFCDYILSRSPEQYYLTTPVVTIVEAKKENLVEGLGQCIATVYAAWRFNEREGTPPRQVYSAVTTGSAWEFIRLQGNAAWIDRDEYYLQDPERLVSLLCYIARDAAPTI